MPIPVIVPEVGESIKEVQISDWLKAEGDLVHKDEPLAVVDSEKATIELPSPDNGVLKEILHRAGETVPVGEVIGNLEPAVADSASRSDKRDEKPSKVRE